MLNTTDKFIKHKAGLLNLAEEPGNVSKACQVMGMSRDTFYRYKAAVEEGGVEALFEHNRRKPNLANRVDEATEQAVVKSALAFPAYGQARTANALRKRDGAGLDADLAYGFGHNNAPEPWPVVAFLQPSDFVRRRGGPGFDAAVALLHCLVVADNRIGEAMLSVR